MTIEPESGCARLFPDAPLPAEAADFSRQFHSLLDGKPHDEAQVTQAFEGFDRIFDSIAAGLYSLASMFAGEGEDSIALVEAAVTNSEVSACDNLTAARRSSRRALCQAALELLARRDPQSLAAPVGIDPDSSCIDDDDLASAGITTEELEQMMAGPDRQRVRGWLESLPLTHRTIFVIRAVAGIPSRQAAGFLREHAGPAASAWTADLVRTVFRQALCSLASQQLHSSEPGS